MNKKEIKRQISEHVRSVISEEFKVGRGNSELVNEAIRFDGENIQLNENVILKFAEKNMNKYQFKFLELREERYIFVRGDGGTFKWFHFGGNTMLDKGDADSDKALEEFIQEKVSRGFRVVNMDSGITKFFKAIGRGLAALMKAMGGFTALVSVVMMVVFLFIGAAGFASLGLAVPAFGGYLAASAIFLGSGWVMGKMSQKQELPMATS